MPNKIADLFVFDPACDLSAEDVEEVASESVSEWGIKIVTALHEGLKEISIDATYEGDKKKEVTDRAFQKIQIKEASKAFKPEVEPEDVVQLVRARCEKFAYEEKECFVTFNIKVISYGPRGKPLTDTYIDKIDGEPGEEEEEDENEQVVQEEHTPPAEPPRSRPVASVVVPMTAQPISPSGLAQAMPATTTRMNDGTELWLPDLLRSVGGEFRAILQQLRVEHGASLRDVAVMCSEMINRTNLSQHALVATVTGSLDGTRAEHSKVVDHLLRELAEARKRGDAMHDKVIQISDRQADSKREHSDGALQRGWAAFEDGMRMKDKALNEIFEAKVEAIQAVPEAAPPAPTPWYQPFVEQISDMLPLAALGVGYKMKKGGYDDGAKAMAKYIGSLTTDDDDEEPRQGQVRPPARPPSRPGANGTQAQARPQQAQAQARPQQAQARPAPQRPTNGSAQGGGPLSMTDALGKLYESFTDVQRRQLKDGLPGAAWPSLEEACAASSDTEATMALMPLGAAIQQDPELENYVRGLLDAQQRILLDGIIDALRRKLGFKRPATGGQEAPREKAAL